MYRFLLRRDWCSFICVFNNTDHGVVSTELAHHPVLKVWTGLVRIRNGYKEILSIIVKCSFPRASRLTNNLTQQPSIFDIGTVLMQLLAQA